ncbi:MAG: precorrin-6A/cobalt-precorrin-6A reductase, partial [Niameybacter sp.]
QGPFSLEMNTALLKHVQAKYLVTKDAGDLGGMRDKMQAALDLGVEIICLERPIEESGLTLEALYQALQET